MKRNTRITAQQTTQRKHFNSLKNIGMNPPLAMRTPPSRNSSREDRKEMRVLQESIQMNVDQVHLPDNASYSTVSSAHTDAITKTPQRGNVSVKLTSEQQTARTIMSSICCSEAYNAHIISGTRGIGKTFVAHNAVQLPLAKKTFTDGIVWVGLGHKKALSYDDLIELYQVICSQVFPKVKKSISFDSVLYVPSKRNDRSEEEAQDEKNAMLHARDIMSKNVAQKKNVLICLDGIADPADIRYFQFASDSSSFKVKCRVLATVIRNDKMPNVRVKLWKLSAMNTVQSRDLFIDQLSTESRHHPDFISTYSESHQFCHGNPLCILSLSQMINDKLRSNSCSSLKKFVSKFESAPVDPKMKSYIILESAFSHSSLGDSNTKLAWRCFAAFACVFSRNRAFRPFVPNSPVRALFRAVISRISKMIDKPRAIDDATDKILDFMVQNRILNRIDGFDEKLFPRILYQVSCDIYQEFGVELSANNGTKRKLNTLFINEYTTMFNGVSAAFGSNEIDFYMLKFLPEHSLKANELEDASLTLQDMRFIEERFYYMGIKVGCKKHIDDTESLVARMKGNRAAANLILVKSYKSCTRVIENQYQRKDSKMELDKEMVTDVMWDLALSLFKENFVAEGCRILQKALELGLGKSDSIGLESRMISSLLKTSSDNKKQCARAIILIGSAMAQSNTKLRDALHLLNNGLSTLEEELGNSSLELARARVYVGEILYRDFKTYQRALQMFRGALPIFMKELGEESEELFDAIILIGKSCIHTGDLDTALEILKNISPKLKGSIALDVDIKVGYIYIIKGNNDKAIEVLSKAKSTTTDAGIIERIEQLINKSRAQQGSEGRYTI